MISDDLGNTFESSSIDSLGRAERIVVGKDTSTIITRYAPSTLLSSHVRVLRKWFAEFTLTKLLRRMNKAVPISVRGQRGPCSEC